MQYTLSPPMHNARFREMGLDYVYIALPVEPENLEAAIKGLRALNIAGANVTIPYKEKVIPLIDTISQEALAIGAVNTLKIEDDGSISGYNTDVYGFLKSAELELGFKPEGTTAIVIGAGGAGKAMASGCLMNNASRLVLVDVRKRVLEDLAESLETKYRDSEILAFLADDPAITDIVKEADLVANATPVGLNPTDDAPIPMKGIKPEAAVYDAIYAVRETSIMRVAREAGCNNTANGLGMLVHQGVRAFEIWTGQTPDAVAMRKLVEQFVYKD
jgi:shikimate dehydrogenase